jgi:ribonuclease Z
VHDTLVGFSRGMFSNWLWHKPLQVVVDAGEGLHLALGSRVHAPTHLLITHGHSDHVLGLPGFIAARRFAMGAHNRPLHILYPAGSPAIELVRGSLARLWPRAAFAVNWIPVEAGDEHPLDKGRSIRAFAAAHPAMERALGYLVLDERRRLKPAFANLPEAEIRQRAIAGERDAMMEPYRHILLAHTGDSMPLAPELFERADLLVHDATFLDAADRRADIHATTGEAIRVGKAAGVRHLVLQHVSVRYPRDGLLGVLRDQVALEGYRGSCWWLDDGELRNVHEGCSNPTVSASTGLDNLGPA